MKRFYRQNFKLNSHHKSFLNRRILYVFTASGLSLILGIVFLCAQHFGNGSTKPASASVSAGSVSSLNSDSSRESEFHGKFLIPSENTGHSNHQFSYTFPKQPQTDSFALHQPDAYFSESAPPNESNPFPDESISNTNPPSDTYINSSDDSSDFSGATSPGKDSESIPANEDTGSETEQTDTASETSLPDSGASESQNDTVFPGSDTSYPAESDAPGSEPSDEISPLFHNIRYKLPSSWQNYSYSETKDRRIYEAGTITLEISYLPMNIDITAPDELEMFFNAMTDRYMDFTENGRTLTDIDNIPAVSETFSASLDGIPISGYTTVFSYDDGVISFIYTTASSLAQLNERYYHEIIASVHFED